MQSCSWFLWCLARRIPRIRFSSHRPHRHHWSRVLFLFRIPLRTADDIGWRVRAERSTLHFHLYLQSFLLHHSSHSHDLLSSSSFSSLTLSYELIRSYYLTQLPSGLAPLLSLTLTHSHPYTNYCLLLSSASSVIGTQTHRHSNQICRSLVFFWIQLLKWDMDTVSAFSSFSVSRYQLICWYLSTT